MDLPALSFRKLNAGSHYHEEIGAETDMQKSLKNRKQIRVLKGNCGNDMESMKERRKGDSA